MSSKLKWGKVNLDLIFIDKFCPGSDKLKQTELLQEGIIFLIYLFARAILSMKELKIEETKTT